MPTLKIIAKSASETQINQETLEEKVLKEEKILAEFQIHYPENKVFDSDYALHMHKKIEEFASAVLEEGDVLQIDSQVLES